MSSYWLPLAAFLVFAICAVGFYVAEAKNAKERAASRRIEEEAERRADEAEATFDNIVERHRATLELKIRQLLYRDSYGKWVFTAVEREMKYFVENVVLEEAPWLADEPIVDPIISRRDPATDVWVFFLMVMATQLADTIVQEAVPSGDIPRNDGLAYERDVASKLAQLGFSIQFTPRTGDQGVDLLAVRGDRKLAVQCKHYQGSVGNDAVQQAYAGARFHEMNEAVVVSSSSYTRAALMAAQSLGVTCLHHLQLPDHFSLKSA